MISYGLAVMSVLFSMIAGGAFYMVYSHGQDWLVASKTSDQEATDYHTRMGAGWLRVTNVAMCCQMGLLVTSLFLALFGL